MLIAVWKERTPWNSRNSVRIYTSFSEEQFDFFCRKMKTEWYWMADRNDSFATITYQEIGVEENCWTVTLQCVEGTFTLGYFLFWLQCSYITFFPTHSNCLSNSVLGIHCVLTGAVTGCTSTEAIQFQIQPSIWSLRKYN